MHVVCGHDYMNLSIFKTYRTTHQKYFIYYYYYYYESKLLKIKMYVFNNH